MQHGLHETNHDQAELRLNVSPVLPANSLKRRRGEVADSESEDGDVPSDQDYGWTEDDNELNAEGILN